MRDDVFLTSGSKSVAASPGVSENDMALQDLTKELEDLMNDDSIAGKFDVTILSLMKTITGNRQ